MNTTKAQRKEIALKAMKKLDIYKPYIDGFKQEDKVCFFEHFGGYWLYQEPEIEAKMKELEKKYNCTVFAVTHEFTDFGELWDFLMVTDYPEEWENVICSEGKIHYAFAYVWNKDDDMCSELGTVGVQSFGGGLMRVA